jgi:hypothetical protein
LSRSKWLSQSKGLAILSGRNDAHCWLCWIAGLQNCGIARLRDCEIVGKQALSGLNSSPISIDCISTDKRAGEFWSSANIELNWIEPIQNQIYYSTAMKCNAMQCNAMQWNVMKWNEM